MLTIPSGKLLNLLLPRTIMRKTPASSLAKDDNGLTAVIEFLSAFALFLMILTAFLSLAQLEWALTITSVDRLDRCEPRY